jgi:hypothetical protein
MAHDISGALRSVMDEARFCRTTATCIWGVSDPRKPVLTPQMPPSLLLTAAPTAARAANSAARLTAVKLLTA